MGQKLNKNKMNMPPTESGRSMVEMLGVLAIIGVLTVGGVAGFNYAMDKHNANEILDNVSKRAIALSPMALQGLDIDSHTLDTEFGTAVGAFPVALEPDQTGFDIIVSKVPRGVCDHVLSGGLKMAEAILLGQDTIWEQGEKSDHTCAETDNEIVFAFNASLDGTQTAGGGNNVGLGNPGEACELGGQAGVETTVYLCDENAQGKCCKVAATTVCVPTGGDTSGLTLTDETNCPATTHKCTGDMKCVCQEACTGGRTQNPTDCSCTCPADKPNWNEHTETCVGCVSDTDCAERADGKNSCDSTNSMCVCPADKKIWNDILEACVQCKTSNDCLDSSKPLCNTVNNTCEADTMGKACKQNSECNSNQYCNVMYDLWSNPRGSCIALDNGTEVIVNGRSLLYSDGEIAQETARNWCLAHGRKAISFSTLSQITGIPINANYYDKSNHTLYQALQGATRWFWTNEKGTKECCFGYYLDVLSNEERVHEYWNHSGSAPHALCE